MSFEFTTAARVIVAAGCAARLPDLVAESGTRVLVCTGAHPHRHASIINALTVPCAVFAVAGEPTVEVIRAATALATEERVDVVLAIGGGSVIDCGKAVAAMLGNGGDPLDYLEIVGSGLPITRRSVPCIAVPTTAGAGAEVTANAVLAVPEHRVKVSMRSPLMIPAVALVDPLLAVECPQRITADSGLDALTQCIEPLVSVSANPIADALAREGLRRAASGLRASYRDGTDIAARTDMATCSLLGGMALANAKLGVVHGFAGALGGSASAAHGALCAATLAQVVEANISALRARRPDSSALQRYEEIARELTGYPGATVEDGVAWIRETIALLAVPSLRSFGFRASDADGVVDRVAKASSTKGNPIVLSGEELRAIFHAAL